jgi:hypothetical protein
MLIVIRNGDELSLKTSFVVEQLNSPEEIICIYRTQVNKFQEKWDGNTIQLATSTSSVVAYYFLAFLKSPRDLVNGLLTRVFSRRQKHSIVNEGFLSILAEVFYFYFATTAKANRLHYVLSRIKSPKTFLIDEFWSISTLNLKEIKRFGNLIYLSQDVAYNRYGFSDNLVTRELMYKFESKVVSQADLVIACSERDKLNYQQMGAKKAVFYPNIYPSINFTAATKDQSPSISIVSRGHWGSKAEKSLEEIFKALASIRMIIDVYVIGQKPKYVPKTVRLHHYTFLPKKLDYLKILSKSWIGINIGSHLAGSNERKYDYSMAGLVVFSDSLGARGDLLPHEYCFVDTSDLSAKLKQLLQFEKKKIFEMGQKNQEQAIWLANNQKEELLKTISSLILINR